MKTKEYQDFVVIGEKTFSISFIGSDEIGKNNPENTEVTIVSKINENIVWKKDLGNIPMPGGAWNGFKIIQNYKSRLLVSLNNSINELEIDTGEIILSKVIGNTVIDEIITDRTNIYILSDYYKFDKSMCPSNLMCLDNNFEIKWYAELPNETDIFANHISLKSKKIICGSWQSWECTINTKNGRILNRIFTK